MAAESPALVVHLGDYIYEDGPGDQARPRPPPRRGGTAHAREYRARYALYKRDAGASGRARGVPMGLHPG
ncbi:alkaline phosphatase D family protein [Candidatus Palauibacter sp.]|uniref:alkaline phosphatase D family protein n=1 Tax=Candidatus Palauibacter sp. TaxID=3101350 RepID=UPI003B011B75